MGLKKNIKKMLFGMSPRFADVLFRRPDIDLEKKKRMESENEILHLDLVITECCSLKCRDCSNLMQYYHTPQNLSTDEVIKDLDTLLGSINLGELKILGGEPFVNPKVLSAVLRYLSEVPAGKVGAVKIITNGTVLPSTECIDAMKNNPKTEVVFSSYGELSSRQNEMIGICRDNGIRYTVMDDTFYWIDFGPLKKHDESDKFVSRQYENCYNRKNCNTLYRGRVYVCPRQAHGIHLGLIPEVNGEYVDLYDTAGKDPEALRQEVIGLVRRTQPVSACGYCLYGKFRHVPPCVQE